MFDEPSSEQTTAVAFDNGQLVRVVLRAVHNDGDQQVNTLHYDLHDASVTWDFLQNRPQSLANFFRDHVMSSMATLYSNVWHIQPVEVVDEKDPLHPTPPRSAWTAGSVITGARTPGSDLLPRACCVVAKLTTDRIGRRYSGRIFIGGAYDEGDQNDGAWSNLCLLRTQTLMDAIPKEPDLSAEWGGSAKATWCVYSRTARAENASTYLAHVGSYSQRTPVHWLRRRAQF